MALVPLILSLFNFTFAAAPSLDTPHGKQVSCPSLNFFNIRKQTKTEVSIDDPPKGWEIISTQNQTAKEDIWHPTLPAGAHIFVRQNDIFLRCDYTARNWVQRWVPGSATIEKKLGQFRLQLLCWTFEGPDHSPVHHVLTKDDNLFLPCLEGTCDALCAY